MMRIPPLLSDKGARKGEKCAKANADSLSKEERRVHHFIVTQTERLSSLPQIQGRCRRAIVDYARRYLTPKMG